MPRVCTACAHPARETLDRALVRGEPKRQIAARHGLAESALGRHARAHLPRALVSAEEVRASASADALLRESLAMQAKALDLMARAEAEGDVRGAIVALKEARECVELRARLGAELRAAKVVPMATQTIQVEYVDAHESLSEKLATLAVRLGRNRGGEEPRQLEAGTAELEPEAQALEHEAHDVR